VSSDMVNSVFRPNELMYLHSEISLRFCHSTNMLGLTLHCTAYMQLNMKLFEKALYVIRGSRSRVQRFKVTFLSPDSILEAYLCEKRPASSLPI
jgi:hypothetical protein